MWKRWLGLPERRPSLALRRLSSRNCASRAIHAATFSSATNFSTPPKRRSPTSQMRRPTFRPYRSSAFPKSPAPRYTIPRQSFSPARWRASSGSAVSRPTANTTKRGSLRPRLAANRQRSSKWEDFAFALRYAKTSGQRCHQVLSPPRTESTSSSTFPQALTISANPRAAAKWCASRASVSAALMRWPAPALASRVRTPSSVETP